MPFLSIIIPLYNVENYLDDCIKSVLAQTCSDFELLLVNDGSSDGSGEICKRYALVDNRIRVFDKENGGVGSARNMGIENSCGRYIWFIDSDDTIEKNSVETLLKKADATDSDMISFNMNIIRRNGTFVPCDNSFDSDLINFEFDDFYRNYYFTYRISFGPCVKLFKGDIVRDNGVRFDTSEKLGEDQIFNVAYFNHIKNFCFISDALYNYVRREASATTLPCADKFTYHFRLFKKKCELIGNHLDDYIGSGLFIMHITCGLAHTMGSCGYLDINAYRKFLRDAISKYKSDYNFNRSDFHSALENFFEAEKTPTSERGKMVRFFERIIGDATLTS